MNKNKKECQNNLENINNLDKLDGSGSPNGNNMQRLSGKSTVMALEKTLGDNNTDLTMKYDHDGIRLWLESIAFSKYFNNFVLSGYESIDFIKEIQNESELQEIDISSKTDCNQILCEIEKLRIILIQETEDNIDEFKIVHHDTRTTDANQCRQNQGETRTN